MKRIGVWRSTTLRFAGLVFLSQIVAAVVLLAGLGAILRAQSNAAANSAAEAMRDDLLETYAEGGAATLTRAIDLRAPQSRGAAILLADRSGRRLAGNVAGMPPAGDRYALVTLQRRGDDAPVETLARITALPGGERLLSGIVVEGDRQLLRLLARASLLILVLALVLAALAAWLAARLIVRRLDATVATIGAVRGGALAARVPADPSHDAFAVLDDEINATLDRVEALVGELKIATDTLAHDLKSPLTRLRAALERAARDVREPEAQAAIERALGEGEQVLALVETALSISRAEAGVGRESFASVDLSALLETVAEIYAPLVEDHGRDIRVAAPEGVCWRAHQQLLGQALGNLVDNALKYGDGTITLSLHRDAGGVTLCVADRGAGIAADQRGEALRRFGRLDSARGGSGAGLGLSLVSAVAHLHGGTVALEDAGPGLIVALTLR